MEMAVTQMERNKIENIDRPERTSNPDGLNQRVAEKKKAWHSEVSLRQEGKGILRDISDVAKDSAIKNAKAFVARDITLEQATKNILDDVSTSSKEVLYKGGEAIAAGIGAELGEAAGRIIGSVIPVVGPEMGGAAGKTLGSIAFSKTYQIAVEKGYPIAVELAGKAKSEAMEAIASVKSQAPEKAEILRKSFNDYWKKHSIPITV